MCEEFTGFPAQMASNAENVFISWHHHVLNEAQLSYHRTLCRGRDIYDAAQWSVVDLFNTSVLSQDYAQMLISWTNFNIYIIYKYIINFRYKKCIEVHYDWFYFIVILLYISQTFFWSRYRVLQIFFRCCCKSIISWAHNKLECEHDIISRDANSLFWVKLWEFSEWQCYQYRYCHKK